MQLGSSQYSGKGRSFNLSKEAAIGLDLQLTEPKESMKLETGASEPTEIRLQP